MPQDSFHIRRLAEELHTALKGGKVNRVSQADKDEVTLTIYTGKAAVKLVLSTNASFARVCLSDVEKEPAPVAPNFCMLLRKHLLGAEILFIRQHEFERIIEITFRCVSDFSETERVLVAELMGKYSNLMLLEGGKLLGALKTASLEDGAHRILLAGATYVYPAPQEKLSPFDQEGLSARLAQREERDSEDTAEFLFENVAGIALPTAREIVARAKGNLAEFVGEFCLHEPNAPCILFQGGKPVDFFAFPVAGGVPRQSLNIAENEFYSLKEGKKLFDERRRRAENVLRALRKKRQKRLADTLERLAACGEKECLRLKGELLTANLYRIQKGEKEVALDNWYDEEGGTVKIALDTRLTPAQNAQKYFKAYAKQKRAEEALEPRKKEEEEEIEYLDSVLASVMTAENATDLKEIEEELISLGLLKPKKERVEAKKKEPTTPFRTYECGGFRIYVGRNNLQNDRLLKSAAPTDIWLHAQKYHSAHAIIAAEGRQVSNEVILFAAELVAYYSDGRQGGKVPIDYCERKEVKKPPKARAGFVVYHRYKTVLVEPKFHGESTAP